MTTNQIIISVIIMSVVTAMIRFAPFVLFAGKTTPDWLTKIGSLLPYSIMGMLVVYCLKNVSFSSYGTFMPELIASLLVVLTYIWKKNTLLSIVCGTLCYMILVQMVFV